MSFVPVLHYMLGLGAFGFVYWLLSGLLGYLRAADIAVSGSTYSFILYLWSGILVLYLVFGGWWLVRRYSESEFMWR